MNNLVTIVVPCKNEEQYIGKLLTSLLNQNSIDDVRIIVADANSTDRTLHIVSCFTPVLNIEMVPGGNVSIGRNNGAQLVETPYILFLDADVQLFDPNTIHDCLTIMEQQQLDLVTLNIKNYGTDWRATVLFSIFNLINRVMTKTTPFAIGAFFLTRRSVFEQLGGFPNKYETSEDYILSKQYNPKKFRIVKHQFGQDERRFKKLGYVGMLWYMIRNFFNRHNLAHFEKAKVNYWN